ncbi:MAG TPA: hypothetical protein VMZ06_17325 [Candidatus Bathyarchaeia archaeon]|nr:hypothetical protein [Candidatus Bathyarchaeia archaeon]
MTKAIGVGISWFLGLAGVVCTILGEWPAQQLSQITGLTVLGAKAVLCIAIPVIVILLTFVAYFVGRKSSNESKHVTVPMKDVCCFLMKSYQNAMNYLDKVHQELSNESKPSWRNRRVHASSLRGLEYSGLLDVPPYILDSADAAIRDNHFQERTKAIEALRKIQTLLYWKFWINHEVAIDGAATMAQKLLTNMSRSLDGIKRIYGALDVE